VHKKWKTIKSRNEKKNWKRKKDELRVVKKGNMAFLPTATRLQHGCHIVYSYIYQEYQFWYTLGGLGQFCYIFVWPFGIHISWSFGIIMCPFGIVCPVLI
jgi:hypothetical protein